MDRIVYWRRELPPLSEQLEGTHELEADSEHVPHGFADRDALWGRCYRSLVEVARARIIQEVERLGGSCAHVVDEQIAARTDDVAGEFWLRGTFRFVMYVHPPA
ncbi:MAG: hypothetical protein H6708_19380 [Kofleriaceae bacterium]|nr:hypothetical protein [Myxococcales bacterium]MCB9562570.1 hypothetical protein [Kofleriaceae bacterium]